MYVLVAYIHTCTRSTYIARVILHVVGRNKKKLLSALNTKQAKRVSIRVRGLSDYDYCAFRPAFAHHFAKFISIERGHFGIFIFRAMRSQEQQNYQMFRSRRGTLTDACGVTSPQLFDISACQ